MKTYNTAEAIVYFLDSFAHYAQASNCPYSEWLESDAYTMCQKIRHSRKLTWTAFEIDKLVKMICCDEMESKEIMEKECHIFFA